MIKHFDFFLVRRPVKSIDWLNEFNGKLSEVSLEVLLKDLFRHDRLCREAILIASPGLYIRLMKWLNNEEISEKTKMLSTLYKYVIRSSSRCTPFGLFSGCALGLVEDQNQDYSFALSEPMPRITFDIETLVTFRKEISKSTHLGRKLALFPNSSIYSVDSELRYIEFSERDGKKDYFISSIAKTVELEMVLDKCALGLSFDQIVILLTCEGFDTRSAECYVDSLIENQIILFGIQPTTCGGNSLNNFVENLLPVTEASRFINVLKSSAELFEDTRNLEELTNILRMRLKALNLGTFDKTLLKVDTIFPNDNARISCKVLTEITTSLRALMLLNRSILPDSLKNFKRRFLETYGDREISLAIVLDSEIGIGYQNYLSTEYGYDPLIDGLGITYDLPQLKIEEDSWQQIVSSKYASALSKGETEIKLDDQDLLQISKSFESEKSATVATSAYAFGNLIGERLGDEGENEVLFNMLVFQGPSAVNMLSRFAGGVPGLNDKLRSVIDKEQQQHPTVLFAEVVHFLDNHAGNVMDRPHLYEYEIPYLGKSILRDEFQIKVDDLMISVREGEIILRSVRLNKRIVPRLSNMHNHRNGLPVYRFLCDLQYQDSNLQVFWSWGTLYQKQYLPRVRYKQIILSRQTWYFRTEELFEKSANQIISFFRELKVPNRFVLCLADNELLIDMNIHESVELFKSEIRKGLSIIVKEFLGENKNALNPNKGEHFVTEVVIPLHNCEVSLKGSDELKPIRNRQYFGIGSEWLYLKVELNEKGIDELLSQVVYPTLIKLGTEAIIDLFFFTRVREPKPYVELRFKGNTHEDFQVSVLASIQIFLNKFEKRNSVSCLSVEPHHRDSIDFGWKATELYERISFIDSFETLTFLAEGSCSDLERMFFAVKKTDALLHHAGYSNSAKYDILKKMHQQFCLILKVSGLTEKEMNSKYRELKTQIFYILSHNDLINTSAPEVFSEFAETQHLEEKLMELIKVSFNRIFIRKHETYGLLIIHCLKKYYRSILAQEEKKYKQRVLA